MSPNLATSFWARNALEEEDHHECLRTVRDRHRSHRVEELGDQGYCSYTILITPLLETSAPTREHDVTRCTKERDSQRGFIVQVRPEQHELDLDVAHEARETYGSLAPTVRRLDIPLSPNLRAFELSYLEGTPYSRLQSWTPHLDPSLWQKQVNLVQSFGTVIAQSWNFRSRRLTRSRNFRADSPVGDNPSCPLPQYSGRVGSQISQKLRHLSQNLPDISLRHKAENVLSRLNDLKDLPVVLNHGDLIPSNILVDEETWKIRGLVDWAEAEALPFGTCLYGLEHLLGYVDVSDSNHPKFVYYDRAPQLRELFWKRLEETTPVTRESKEFILLARDMGVLLWYGYAWDEGAIDRVVNDEDDRGELACLREFLGSAIE